MTKISDERLAEMLAYTPTHADNKADRVFYRELRLIIRELQQLRAHNSDSAEPVALEEALERASQFVMPRLLELGRKKGYVGVWSDGFRQGWAAALASPPVKEVTTQSVCAHPNCNCSVRCEEENQPTLLEAYKDALAAAELFADAASVEETNWTGWGEQIVPPDATMRRVKAGQALKALMDADPRMRAALTNRTPDDEVGNG